MNVRLECLGGGSLSAGHDMSCPYVSQTMVLLNPQSAFPN
jgi:hypothetical protein